MTKDDKKRFVSKQNRTPRAVETEKIGAKRGI